ncbi:MaoC family dehydratase N-terminal domain-containing protein [Streptomyces sp. NPDC048002]|uniref:FAS1-like dehydratase domain-containing protein n=1 Tax=Streptomyces sp. NPDC048002 TaxID=3154344 RepID=UPI0033EC5E99
MAAPHPRHSAKEESMSTLNDEQHALDEALEEYVRETNSRVGEVKPVPVKRTEHHEYTLAYRHVTEDLIRMFTVANGDTNPLWRDGNYATGSPWGGIVAPPLYFYTAAATTALPEPPRIAGFDLFHGGSRVRMHRPIRHGDTLSAQDVWNGVENRSRPGRPHRTLLFNGERRFYNQDDELVAALHTRIIGTARLPGTKTQGPKIGPDREIRPYSDTELKEVQDHYDDELAGKLRRGSQPRYWEDVREGDDLGTVLKGPLDILDLATFTGVVGAGIAHADKWEMIRTELSRSPRDPQTRALHYQMDWHLFDASAQAVGMPRAINFGAYMDINATHLVNNWLGDHGWFLEFDSRVGAPMFVGDLLRISGKVVRAYEEHGRGLVELALTGTVRDDIEVTAVRAIVQLPHRGFPDEVVHQVLSDVGA